MPAWLRNSVRKKTVTLVGSLSNTSTTTSDASGVAEAAAADSQLRFLNVEKVDANVSLFVYRSHGSRPDLMRTLDTSAAFLTVTQAGVYEISWPAPLGAASRTTLLMTVSTTSSVEAIFELDDVYRTDG